jgi:hypothetical protein
VALNQDVHCNLKFAANETNYSFAPDTTVVLVAGVVFAEAAREYPTCSNAAMTKCSQFKT